MIVKTYGLYDGIAKEYIRTFTSANDETAQRACEYIVRAPDFDKIAGKDYSVCHLYDFDSSTGAIVDNDVHIICSLASFINKAEFEDSVKKDDNLLNDLISKVNTLSLKVIDLEKHYFSEKTEEEVISDE